MKKPETRSSARLAAGRLWFTVGRRLIWLFGSMKFAKKTPVALEYMCFSHKTPLLRQLGASHMHLQHNKIINLKIAVPRVSGVTVYPGETFSYWKLIGRPSRLKGYVNGMVLRNGAVHPGIGGGLCQLSNLIYWMTIHTPLTVVERHRHGYDVFPDSDRKQPFGSGATCFYNYGDLMIRNDTPNAYQLLVEVGESYLTGMWMSDSPPSYRYEAYEKDHFFKSEHWGGYTRHNTIYRRKYDMQGNLEADEFVVENHAIMMYSPLLP